MQSTEGRARPRVGLLGNPSDLYGGAVVAFTFEDFLTRVNLEPADSLVLAPGEGAPVPVGDGLNRLDHVCREQDRATARDDATQCILHPRRGRWIESVQGLVEHEDARL